MKICSKGTAAVGALTATAALVGASMAPAAAQGTPQGYFEDDFGVGYSYSTFDEDPNLLLLIGGDVEDFCLDAPEDPFGFAEPGEATSRTYVRNSGRVDIKVDDSGQPIHLYEADAPPPVWLPAVCDDFFDDDPATIVPTPLASGDAHLKVRISVLSESVVDVFNSVNGTASSSDGTTYKVRAQADLIVEDGVPVGDPTEFVQLAVKQIGR